MLDNKIRNLRGRPKKILAASMGDCVHVAGVLNFLRLADEQGYKTEFLGAAIAPENLARMVKKKRADILAVGYRLDPDASRNLIARLRKALDQEGIHPILFFGGTPPVAKVARESGMFQAVFSGVEDIDEIIAFLKNKVFWVGEQEKEQKNLQREQQEDWGRSQQGNWGEEQQKNGEEKPHGNPQTSPRYPDNLVERISWKSPYPILRHHFGLPSVAETEKGILKIAEAGVIDVVSLGPDQNAQENFFTPNNMDPDQDGSGGVPIRTREDLERLYQAARRGNYPLMRCYSGTQNVIGFAKLLHETIRNAWGAIPLCWYNVLDRRGPREVLESITEAQENMAWHAQEGIPVEVNESHHWSLRDAPDVVAVAAAYLAAYNAKKMGVRHYISQYMFNTPPGITAAMDLGKMLAKDHLIRSLEDGSFTVFTQVRAGLSSFPAELGMAKGQLATSTLVAMNMKPQIVHVVGFCEGDHIAQPEDVIESARIARGVIRNCLDGMPDMTLDPRVQDRKNQLIREAKVLLAAIAHLGEYADQGPEQRLRDGHQAGPGRVSYDPLTDPKNLALAIKIGLLDAPHLRGNPAACGEIRTSIVGGACVAVDQDSGRPISEEERVARILEPARKREYASAIL